MSEPNNAQEARIYREAYDCAYVEAVEAFTPRDLARRYAEQAADEALSDHRHYKGPADETDE